MENKIITFDPSGHLAFKTELLKRIEAYFKDSGQGKKANSAMILKIVIILFLFTATYIALISNLLPPAMLLVFTVLFGISNVLIAFNISHDAAHNALFINPKTNYLFSYTFNLIGVNRYIWDIKHNRSHHAFTNMPGLDLDIEQIKIARIVGHVPQKWYYKYQHIYIPLLYPFTSLYMIFIKDFLMFAAGKYGNSLLPAHPKKEYIILIASKSFYFFYTLIIPLMFISQPWYYIVAGFILMHMIQGTFLAAILFPVHALHDSPFPKADKDGLIHNNWFKHQIEVSTNFGVKSKLLFWLSGGLNIHIPHHLFPGICHIHYYNLAPIIKEVALSHGILYRENTLAGALRSHFQLLEIMGKEKVNA